LTPSASRVYTEKRKIHGSGLRKDIKSEKGMSKLPTKDEKRGECSADDAIDTARREALERLGRLAAYTPPAMLTLLLSKRASAQSVGLGPPPPPPPPPLP
jgi:hypothetical protein